MENTAIIVLGIVLQITILTAFIIIYKLAKINHPHMNTKK